MRAVVALGGRLTCEEVADPEPGPGQVLVRTLCCGICGTDLHALNHLRLAGEGQGAAGGFGAGIDPKRGVVFGHEFAAELLDYGPRTERRLRRGARLVSMPFIAAPSGVTAAVGLSSDYPGGYGEQMLLTEAMLIEIPNGLSDRHAAMTEPFAVGAHAVGRAAIDAPSAALVVGCGPVGLAVIAALKVRGFGPVAAADFSPIRRRIAEQLGADIVIDPAETSPHAAWAEMGVHADGLRETVGRLPGLASRRAIIFECVGVPGMLQALVEACPNGAQIIVVGACMEPDQFRPFTALAKQLDFRFVVAYAPEEFAATLRRIAEGQIDVSPVITGSVGLDGIAGAFAALATPDTQVKIVVEPA